MQLVDGSSAQGVGISRGGVRVCAGLGMIDCWSGLELAARRLHDCEGQGC